MSSTLDTNPSRVIAVETAEDYPRVLMLGMGWFPGTLDGLDRYYRSLFEQLPEARGVVIGPAEDAPAAIKLVAHRDSPLIRRVLEFWLAARRAARDAEVVNAHLALYAAAPLLLGKLRRLPTVFHFHGPWAEENLAAGNNSRIAYALRGALERSVLRRADAHVVLSAAFRRLLVERYGVRPWDIHVWAPGVDLDVFTPDHRSEARSQLGLDPSAFVVVCTRRLVPRMGIDGLLDAWGQLQGELPEGSTLLLVGEGPLREALDARAANAPLAGRVRVMGRLPDHDLIDAYRAADVAVVPSIAVEGFGLVVLEAAACGTPSITSDVGGLPEVSIPLDPSLVVGAGDTDALAARIRAAAQGALPARSATRAYAERFDWRGVAALHRGLHRRLIDGKRDERLRVVYLDHVSRLSGGEIALLRLLPHLRGVNAHVILGEDGPFATSLQQAGISVEVLPIGSATRELRKDAVRIGLPGLARLPGTLAYVLRLALRLRALQPDLVHTNSLKAGVYGSIAARAVGVPMIWHVRDRLAEDYLPSHAIRLIRGLVGQLADGVIAYAPDTLETLGPGRRGALQQVIPDSVELSPYPHAASRSDETIFGMVGRIAPWKGQDLFLRAFAAAFPNGGARAVVVGSAMFGEEQYERELFELVTQLGLTEHVEFRGFRPDVWRELASFDVLVHASVTPEPFGQVVIEGMAAGLPVIAPDEGGPVTMIADGETGRLFKSRDPAALAATMRSLHEDPAECERLGASARHAVARYHPDAVAEQLERLYDRVAAHARQRS